MIELRTLGGLDLHDFQGHELRVILAAPKRAALLTYLAIATPRGFHRRDTLLALLWPKLDQEHARSALRQALHRMRRSMTEAALLAEGDDTIALDRDAFWCDAVAFELLLDGGKEEEALALYRGELLEGFHLSGCLEFERWLEDERLRLKRRAGYAAWSLVEQAEAHGNLAKAGEWARRATALVPNDETALRRLIALLDRVGNRAGAIREYEAFAKRLREDYEAEPAPETTELIEAVRAREQANGSVLPSAPLSAPLTKQPVDTVQANVTTQPRPSWRTRGRAAAAIVVLGSIAAFGAMVMRNGRGDAPALDPTRVLIDIFQNETGDPSLDALGRMATDRVTAGLTYSTFVDVVSLGTQLLSREPVGAGTSFSLEYDDLETLARANGTGTVVWGSYYLQGDSLHFIAHVTNAATGEELATIEPVRGPVDAPLAALERLRDRVMTTLATLTDPRLAKWMRYASKPPTFEAYTEFVEGVERVWNREPSEAIPYFLRAAALDADFTMALLWAASAYGNRADSILQALNVRRAQLAPLDRLLLDYQLSFYGGDRHGALETLRRVLEIAPGSEFLWRAGALALRLDRPREAIEFLTQVDPESGWLRGWVLYWDRLTRAYHEVGDYEAELEALDRMRQLHPNAPRTLGVEMRVLGAGGRIEELGLRIPEAIQRSTGRALFINGIPFGGFRELRAHGYPAAASNLADRTLEWFEGRTSDWRQDPGQSFVYAKLLSQVGRWVEAQAILEEVLKAVPLPSAEQNNATMQLTYALASQGKRDQAFRTIGVTSYSNLPEVRAWIEAALGERERAMELLRESGFEIEIHRGLGLLESLREYPPFVEEFMRPKG